MSTTSAVLRHSVVSHLFLGKTEKCVRTQFSSDLTQLM